MPHTKGIKQFFIIFITFIVTSITAFANEEPYGYITTEPVVVYGYNLISSASDPAIVLIANPNLIFRQIGDVRIDPVLGSVYVIQFWKITKEHKDIANDATKINASTTKDNQFYCIKSDSYKEPTIKKRYKTWRYNAKLSVGTLVVPLKYRFKLGNVPNDFTNDFTLGNSFGGSFRMSHFQQNYLSLVAIFGITNVGIDSVSTNGLIKDANVKVSAITPAIGIVTEISNFQIGGVIGWDIIGGSLGQKWIYNNKPWLSFGIGYQFMRKSE